MYDKLNELIDKPQDNEKFLKQAEFLMTLPKKNIAKMGQIRELFDSVSKDDLLAIRENLCKSSVYYEDDLEFCFGEKVVEPSLYTLMDGISHYELLKINSNAKKRFF